MTSESCGNGPRQAVHTLGHGTPRKHDAVSSVPFVHGLLLGQGPGLERMNQRAAVAAVTVESRHGHGRHRFHRPALLPLMA